MVWKYACGHESNAIIMDSNLLSLSAYYQWAETVGVNGTMKECWACWNEKKKAEVLE